MYILIKQSRYVETITPTSGYMGKTYNTIREAEEEIIRLKNPVGFDIVKVPPDKS